MQSWWSVGGRLVRCWRLLGGSAAVHHHAAVLEHTVDLYNGVSISSSAVSLVGADAAGFSQRLGSSLARWSAEQRCGVWLTIPIDHSALIPVAARHGFEFHHCLPTSVVMTRWLPQDRPNKLPAFATTNVGVGSLVIRPSGDMLVITEKHNISGSHPDMWKIPGGSLELGEDMGPAAERELLQETGIRAKFRSVLGFRHLHGYNFGTDDLYFIVLLDPDPEKGGPEQQPVPEDGEVERCQWMPISAFLALPQIVPMQREIGNMALRIHQHHHVPPPAQLRPVEMVASRFGKKRSTLLYAGWQ